MSTYHSIYYLFYNPFESFTKIKPAFCCLESTVVVKTGRMLKWRGRISQLHCLGSNLKKIRKYGKGRVNNSLTSTYMSKGVSSSVN